MIKKPVVQTNQAQHDVNNALDYYLEESVDIAQYFIDDLAIIILPYVRLFSIEAAISGFVKANCSGSSNNMRPTQNIDV